MQYKTKKNKSPWLNITYLWHDLIILFEDSLYWSNCQGLAVHYSKKNFSFIGINWFNWFLLIKSWKWIFRFETFFSNLLTNSLTHTAISFLASLAFFCNLNSIVLNVMQFLTVCRHVLRVNEPWTCIRAAGQTHTRTHPCSLGTNAKPVPTCHTTEEWPLTERGVTL